MVCRKIIHERMILFLILLIVIPMITGQVNPSITSRPNLKQNEANTISLPCTINGNYCSGNATCRTTIINPQQLILFNDYNMTRNNAVFEVNLSANQTEINGEYQFNVVCSDNGRSISRFLKFYVSPNGEEATAGKGMIYLGLLAVLFVLFIFMIFGGVKAEYIPIKTFLFMFGFVIIIGISFISWNLARDYLTSSPFLITIFKWTFYFLIVAFFPTLLISFIFMFYMMTQIDAVQNMIKRGMPEDEAYEREVKGGLRGIGRRR